MIRSWKKLSDNDREWWTHVMGAMQLGQWPDKSLRAVASLSIAKPGGKAHLCALELQRREALDS